MWHVALVPRRACSTLLTASWTHATARCRGLYACYIVLCVNIELNYNLITSKCSLVTFLYELYQYCNWYYSSNMWSWHTWKWIKVLHCIFLPTTFSFLQCQVELCLVGIIIANSVFFVPSCVPWSQTAMHQVREPWGQAQDLLLNTFELFLYAPHRPCTKHLRHTVAACSSIR